MNSHVHTFEDRYAETTAYSGHSYVVDAMLEVSLRMGHAACQSEFLIQRGMLIQRLAEHGLIIEPQLEKLVIKRLKMRHGTRFELTVTIPPISNEERARASTIYGGTPTTEFPRSCCPAACGIRALMYVQQSVVPTLPLFFSAVRNHDWFWYMADDYRAYKRGAQQEQALLSVARRMGVAHRRVYNTVAIAVRTHSTKELTDVKLPFPDAGLDGNLLHSLRNLMVDARSNPERVAEVTRQIEARLSQ